VAPGLFGIVSRQILGRQGPRPDQTHLSLQDVEQFSQFIQRTGTKELSKPGGPDRIWQEIAIGIPGVGHCSQLDQLKFPGAESGALLTVEDGPSHRPTHDARQD
jgi:hypothetical protein